MSTTTTTTTTQQGAVAATATPGTQIASATTGGGGGKKKALAALKAVLLSPGLEVAEVLCDARVSHDWWQIAADPLARVFLAHGAAVPLLKKFIDADVAASPNAESLFRVNSPATRMMGALYKVLGGEYLKPLLFPCVVEVLSTEREWEGDVDGEERAMELCRSTLLRVFESAPRCPRVLRLLFRHVRDTAGARFPQARLVSVGSFFFLRFLVPALASPKVFGVTDEVVRPRAKRGLVLISAAVQKCANGQLSALTERLPGAAETSEKFFPMILDFLEQLCDVPAADADQAAASAITFTEEPAFPIDDDLVTLQDCIVKSLPDVVDALAKRFPQYDPQPLRDAVSAAAAKQAALQQQQYQQLLHHSKHPSTTAAMAAPPTTPAMPPQTSQLHDTVATSSARPATESNATLAFDIHREVQTCLGELTSKTEKLYRAMASRLESEMAARRKAEAECRALRAELDLLHRRYAVDTSAIVPVAGMIAAVSSDGLGGGGNSSGSGNEVLSQDQRHSEILRKRELLATIGEIHTALDDLRMRVNDPSDINDAIFVGKLVRELHTLVQMPLGKQAPESKPIPRQFDVTTATWEKTKPLRTATAKALDEIKGLRVSWCNSGPPPHTPPLLTTCLPLVQHIWIAYLQSLARCCI